MNNKFILVVVFALFAFSFAQARILRVNNNPGSSAQYTSWNAVYSAAVSGDTIYVEGSTASYSISNSAYQIKKKLTIIGPGYFLSENGNSQTDKTATFYWLNFATGSEGSEVKGLNIAFLIDHEAVNNLTFTNNKIAGFWSNTYSTNMVIKGNYISGSNGQQYMCNNLIFTNNYWNNTANSPTINTNKAIITNNIIRATYPITLNNTSFSNNIIISGTLNGSGNTFYNNLTNGTQVPEGNGNQRNVNMNDVFVCYSTCTGFSTDARYMLKDGSPAIGAGLYGEDCGIFGGDSPYILSGMPNIPSIYQLSVPGTATQNNLLKVTIKAKSN